MAETEDIVQRILLTGNNEVVEALKSIQEAGTQAFEALEKAAETQSLLGLVGAITGVAAAVSGLTVAAFAWTREASEAVNSMSELGAQAGTTIDDITSLVSVLARTGGNADEMAASFRRAAVTINTSWVDIKKAARDSADSLRSDYFAIETATIALARAQENSRNQYKVAADLEINNANNLKEAQLNLRDAYERLRVAQGGRPRSASAEREAQEQRALLAVQQARQRLEEQERKAEQDKIDAANKAREAAIAAETAQLNLNAARKKAAEDAANDINNVTAAVNRMASGQSDAFKNINASADNVVRGIISSVGQTSNALKGLSGSLYDLNSPAPQVKDVLLKLADVFHSTNDAALKTAVAVRFFGHAISQDTIDALSEGSAAILEHQKHLNSLGLTYTKAEDSINRRFRESMSELIEDVKIIGNKFALTFAPIFTDVFTQLTHTIEHNRSTFLSWAESISNAVKPIISGLVASFSGFHLDSLKADQFVKADEWRAIFERIEGYVTSFVTKVKTFFTETIPVSANVLIKALEGIAYVFEKITGIKLTPEQMGLTLLVGQITGINGVIFHLGELIIGLGLIFATTSVPIALFGVTANVSLGTIVITLGLLIGAAYLVYNAFKKLSDPSFWEDMDTSTQRTTARIMATLSSLKMMWEWIKGNISYDEFKKFNEDIDHRIERDFPDPETKRKRAGDASKKEGEEQGGIFDEIKKLLIAPSEAAKKNLDEAKRSVTEGADHGAAALTGSATSLKEAAAQLFGAGTQLNAGRQGGSGRAPGGGPSFRTVGSAGGPSDPAPEPTYGIRRAPTGSNAPEPQTRASEPQRAPGMEPGMVAPSPSPTHAQPSTAAPTIHAQPSLNGEKPPPGAPWKQAKNYIDSKGIERNPDGTVAVGSFLPGEKYPATGINPNGTIGSGVEYDPNQPYNDPTGVRPRPFQGTYKGLDEGWGVFDAPNFAGDGVEYGYGPGARHDDVFSRTEYNEDHLKARREYHRQAVKDEKEQNRRHRQRPDLYPDYFYWTDPNGEFDRYAFGGPVGEFLHYAAGGTVGDGVNNGGEVDGPGTGTSDSIMALIDGKRPAKISKGEFIVRADGSNLMDAFRFFAKSLSPSNIAGTLFGASAPAFATGGPVESGGAAQMGYYAVDLRTDKGTFRVQADEATAQKLNKQASFQRMVSTGKNPEWYT